MNRTQLLSSLLLCLPLSAQGLLVGPGQQTVGSPGPTPRNGGVAVVRTAIHPQIVDGLATTAIDPVFRNDGARDAQGTWFLPLPRGAVADGFVMTVNGKEIAGEVLDAGQARSVYETIVRQRRDPGLLEYAGEGMLRARIFPIPARGEVGVTVRLRQVLEPVAGMYQWTWPMRSMRLGDAGQGSLAIDVSITSQTAIGTLIAPYENAEIERRGECAARITFEGKTGDQADLEVLYGLREQEFGLHLLTWRTVGDPGYFAMLVSPPRELVDERLAPRRCVQFVVDTSGSMAGRKLDQAKAALRAFVQSLRTKDLFQIVTFSSGVQTFFDAPREANAENVAAALARIDALSAMGGTNISGALEQALSAKLPAADDGGVWLPQIVFVTDGEPTMGLTNPQQILELTKRVDTQGMRLFAFGVGDQIDVRLIDDLAQQHRGARDFVRSDEKIETKVSALCQKLRQPALSDVEVRCDGLDSFDVHPAQTRDLFCGEMLQVVGRYRNHGRYTVHVRGTQNGAAKDFAFQVDFPKLAEQNSFVQTVWARQHVATLLDAIRRTGAKQELVDEVRKIATRYGIVTPYTSQLIVEEGMRLGAPVAAGRDGGEYRGPADALPTSAAPAGPSTGGPAAPAAPSPGSAGVTRRLQDLGKARSGEGAIAESEAVTGSDDFYLGGGRAKAAESKNRGSLLRRAAGRVFVPVGDELVEQGLPADWAKQAVVVEAFSDEYFALLKRAPGLREVLALGERVAFRDGERIVHVKPAEKPVEKPAEKPAEKPTEKPAEKPAAASGKSVSR